jgi:hypothetical protein
MMIKERAREVVMEADQKAKWAPRFPVEVVGQDQVKDFLLRR